MQLKFLILFTILFSQGAFAQYTAIPDANFEQVLIELGIDSETMVDGQILTGDVENLTILIVDGSVNSAATFVTDLSGIQDFVSLEKLTVNFTLITTLDISQNVNLKELDCSSNQLTELNLSANSQLEKLFCGNIGLDIGPYNTIEEVDLSQNPGINTVNAYDMNSIKKINLNNGNNTVPMSIEVSLFPWGMDNPNYDPNEIRNTVCIQIDDETLVDQLPYSAWEITTGNHVEANLSENCILSLDENIVEITFYPNPVKNILMLETPANITIDAFLMYDCSGRNMMEVKNPSERIIDVSQLQPGIYLLKVYYGKDVFTKKIIVQ